MRLFGHPVHVMLIHFPVALWPAHWLFHVFAARLPSGVGPAAGWWLLVGGCVLGWLAAFFGALDLLALWRDGNERKLTSALIHGLVNGSVVLGFTVLAALEYGAYPEIRHGYGFLGAEAALLLAMFVGNYFGGAIVWADEPASAQTSSTSSGNSLRSSG